VIAMASWFARTCSSRFHSRKRAPLLPPQSAAIRRLVNGQVLMEDGKHSGALPGRVLRNPYYRAHHVN
jgi:hypothetical protein